MTQKIAAVVAAFALFSQDAAFAKQAPQKLPAQAGIAWSELGGFVVEKNVSITLPDSTRLEGEVLAVRPESLVLDVRKTSNKKLHPKEQTEIPSTSVREVKIIRHAGPAMRIVGGILGALGGCWGAASLGLVTDSIGVMVPAILILIPMSAVGGYYAGKLADRRTTLIRIQQTAPTPAAEEEEQQ
jgi:hypothetical protein